jgi:transposase
MTKQFEKLTDSNWVLISEYLNIKRKRKICLRSVLNAILYITRAGCQWRNLPLEYPHWRAVNYYFEQWKKDGTFDNINMRLNQEDRKAEGRNASPSLLCIDSQSVKLTPMICEDRGIDGNKKVNGRKRQILVDSGGRIWAAVVHAANINDGIGGLELLEYLPSISNRLEKILTDSAYKGIFEEEVKNNNIKFEVSTKPETTKGFVPLKQRWVVERTFAWTNFFRRITKDYEYTILSSAAWLILANITIMTQRLLRF